MYSLTETETEFTSATEISLITNDRFRTILFSPVLLSIHL